MVCQRPLFAVRYSRLPDREPAAARTLHAFIRRKANGEKRTAHASAFFPIFCPQPSRAQDFTGKFFSPAQWNQDFTGYQGEGVQPLFAVRPSFRNLWRRANSEWRKATKNRSLAPRALVMTIHKETEQYSYHDSPLRTRQSQRPLLRIACHARPQLLLLPHHRHWTAAAP